MKRRKNEELINWKNGDLIIRKIFKEKVFFFKDFCLEKR